MSSRTTAGQRLLDPVGLGLVDKHGDSENADVRQKEVSGTGSMIAATRLSNSADSDESRQTWTGLSRESGITGFFPAAGRRHGLAHSAAVSGGDPEIIRGPPNPDSVSDGWRRGLWRSTSPCPAAFTLLGRVFRLASYCHMFSGKGAGKGRRVTQWQFHVQIERERVPMEDRGLHQPQRGSGFTR